MPRQLEFDHAIEKPRHRRQRLGTLAVWNERYRKFLLEGLANRLEDARLRDKQERSAKPGRFEMFFKMLKGTRANDDVVNGVCADGDA